MSHIKKRLFIIIFFFSILMPAQADDANAQIDTDAATGLKSWKLTQSGLELQLVQRLPDQTRGFYQGRGFSKQQANAIATQCVFQTIVKNINPKKTDEPISISLKTWRLKTSHSTPENPTQGIKLKEDWAKEWQAIEDKAKQVKTSARVAFKWSTFPSEQTFEPGGDYNWGMISFGLAPGEIFDLHVFWQTTTQSHSKWLKNIQCPPDIELSLTPPEQ